MLTGPCPVLAERSSSDVPRVASRHSREFKEAVTAAVIAVLDPLQQRYADMCADPGMVMAIARDGAAKAQELALPTLARAKRAIGLLTL